MTYVMWTIYIYIIYSTGGAVSVLAYSSYIESLFTEVTKFTTVIQSGLLLDTEATHYDLHSFASYHNLQGEYQ